MKQTVSKLTRILILFLATQVAGLAEERVFITEFMASNRSGLQDEDGDNPDWIEIYNAGTAPVNLLGWHLTDSAANLTKWRFPAVILPPDSFLVVFASDKNRRDPESPLHTNFRLSGDGEYLGLTRPDGTVAFAYSPVYPPQLTDVSFGLSTASDPIPLIAQGTPAKVFVPADNSLGTDWLEPLFDDGAWTTAVNGIGFSLFTNSTPPGIIADSVAGFSGVQGSNNWFHGYYDKTADADGVYQPEDFTRFLGGAPDTVRTASNHWNGNEWRIFPSNPPWTSMSASAIHPNGTNTGPEHWAIRRWQSTISGWVRVVFHVSKTNPSGDGVTGRVYHNGTLLFTESIVGNDTTGFTATVEVEVAEGDFLDFAHLPQGPAGIPNDGADGSILTATIEGVPTLSGAFATDVGGLMHNQNPTAYLRIPFTVEDASKVDLLTLRMKYDDGFVAFLNGEEVARRNAPNEAEGFVVANSVTEFSSVQGQAGWTYGYYDQTADLNGAYDASDFTPFPRADGAWGVDNYWTGTLWDWFNGNPPWTEISSNGGHPNGSNNGAVHWAIRRWESSVSGAITVRFRISKSNLSCGNGVTGRIFHNGVEKFFRTVAFNDGANIVNNVVIEDVSIGDFIDLALDPTGTDGQPTDGCDGSIFTAVIERGVPLTWNTAATAENPNERALLFEEFDLTPFLDGIQTGNNLLAIHGLNVSADDADFLIVAELDAATRMLQLDEGRYFTTPTPGAPNDFGTGTLGPIVSQASHWPNTPEPDEPLYVTAQITPAFAPVQNVQLTYRVMFGAETTLPMFDDGENGDAAPGDGIYGARLPAGLAPRGQMIRWFIRATDSEGRVSRFPTYHDPVNSPQYLGTIVYLEQTNNLPILHWFIQSPSAAETDAGTRASLFYLDEFYDNIFMNIHGQSSRGFPKKSYNIDLNSRHRFLYDPNEERVGKINLLTTYPDKAHMRNLLAYGTHRDAGSPYHWVHSVRMHQNGQFFSEVHMVEQGNEVFLRRIGLDPNGALYKMYNTFTTMSHTTIGRQMAQKRSRKHEGNADLVALLNGVTQGDTAARARYLYDNVNIPQVINYLAAMIITGNVDCCHKNYYIYRDSDGTGEWYGLPWDVDLSFGRVWTSAMTYWDDRVNFDTRLFIGNNNGFFGAVLNTPAMRQMYLRRIRTLMEELLQPPGTPPEELRFEKWIDELHEHIGPDAALDFARWPTWGNGSSISTCCIQTMPHAVDILKTNYLPARRVYMFTNLTVTGGGEIPLSQPPNAIVRIAAVDYNPASGNQAEEYIQISNTNNFAVDISGWTLAGGIDYTFQPGMVIPANSSVYVSPDVKAFRARTTGPRGGQSLLVQGNYQGQLSARGETIRLTAGDGREVHEFSYPGTPSLAQQFLRITELMYNPHAPGAGSPFGAQEFEFVELKNIGSETINLSGVRFVDGIQFDFTGSAVTNLGPGEFVLVVKNLAAFTERYGAGFNIAGEYGGNLDNSGERLRLNDASNEKVLDFTYNNSWHRITEGHGFSLVIVDETVPWNIWTRRTSWRASGAEGGSPGADDPLPAEVSPILVNEIISNPLAGGQDAIELFNPNAQAVDLSGWYLSDSFNTAKKFRIPQGTVIPAGGYVVFTDEQFNVSGQPGSFGLGARGDSAYVYSGNAEGSLTGYYHGFRFGASERGVSFGRHITSTGEEHFVAQSAASLGSANASPKVGPVIISEIMYHPGDPSGTEYVELKNISAAPVNLFDAAHPTNTWQFTNGISFSFPPGVILPPDGHLLVVDFDPVTNSIALAKFRDQYALSDTLPLFGPFRGRLNNAGDSVQLYRPEPPVSEMIPWILTDQVDYSGSVPWATAANGLGASLQRLEETAYGNDPVNWAAAQPSPGAAYGGGVPPVILVAPAGQSGVATFGVTFSVEADGATPLSYQWRFEGANIPGANDSTLVLNDLQPSQAGAYTVVVFNSANSVESDPAMLTILIPVKILAQPKSINARPGSNVTFTVTASSSTAISYQWRLNGEDIPGATEPDLAVPDVQVEDDNYHFYYSVVLTDEVGPVVSETAALTVLVNPTYLLQPQSQTVLQGETVHLEVAVTGTPPFGYRWRKGSAPYVGFDLGSNILIITNAQPSDSATYTAVTTNIANSSPGVLSAQAVVSVLVDSDGDGMADEWEILHGLDPNNPDDALLDNDGDGMSNRDEYIAGTDPNDPESYLKLEASGVSELGNAILRFDAVARKTYTIQAKDVLGAGDWLKIMDVNSATTNRVLEITDPSPHPSGRYYRLVTPKQ